jgi:thioredoxin reductase (NADPH)
MSSLPVTRSALDASSQTFPTLTEAQIARVRPLAKLRKIEPGEVLFRPRDHGIPFFIVLSGKLEIVQADPLREEVNTK